MSLLDSFIISKR